LGSRARAPEYAEKFHFSADLGASKIALGVSDEWHLVNDNSFCHQGFEHVAGPAEEVVAFLASLEVTRLVAAGTVADSVSYDGGEELVVKQAAA
jgi:hypothetical protein